MRKEVLYDDGTSKLLSYLCLKIIKDGDESRWMNHVFLLFLNNNKKLLIIFMSLKLLGFLASTYIVNSILNI